MSRSRAANPRLKHVAEAGAATATIAVESAIAAPDPTVGEPRIAIAQKPKRKRSPRATAVKPEAIPKVKTARAPRKTTKAAALPVATTTLADADATVAAPQKPKRKPRAKSVAVKPLASEPLPPKPIADDAANLANLVDSLRGRVAPMPSDPGSDVLPAAALELFERCARDYQRESDKLLYRRRQIGALVYPATPGQVSVISDWFVRTLGLRMVDIDATSLVGLSHPEVAGRLAPLNEPTARIVTIRGIGRDTDPRVFAAIASAHVDVLAIAFVDHDTKLRVGVQRRLRYRIDLFESFPFDVAPGYFDGIRHEYLVEQPDFSDTSTKLPGKKFGFFERLVSFFRSRIQTIGS